MDFYRLGVKVFAADPTSVRLEKLIPVFHRWIQRQNVPGHLLIDVHDYSHLPAGPGILLVGQEGNFSLDTSGGRPGLMYYRKMPTALAPTEHFASVLKSAVQACRLLEKDARLRFNMGEFSVFANDRLHAPNTEETFRELRSVLADALRQVFDGADFEVTRTSQDPKERLTLTCTLLQHSS